jgi:hypothetical protein
MRYVVVATPLYHSRVWAEVFYTERAANEVADFLNDSLKKDIRVIIVEDASREVT